MISNKYGIIFIHPPKTAGTSIHAALHRDLDQECMMATGKDYENFHKNDERYGTPELPAIEYEDEVTHVVPSKIDFPWWQPWVEKRRKEDLFYMKAIIELEETHKLKNLHLPTYPGAIDSAFGISGWQGNIKHFPFFVWYQLMADQRFTQYGSFNESYTPVATVRNPYKREFSVFLYSKNKFLQNESKGLRKNDISKLIQREWAHWTHRWQSLGEETSLFINPPSNPNTYISSQASYLIAEEESNSNKGTPLVSSYIRAETLEQDYNDFCDLVGIKVKGPVPHLLNNSNNWKQYLPENIVDWYTDKNIEDIHRIRKEDFELLGYKKENR